MDPFLFAPSYWEEFIGQSAAVNIGQLIVEAARRGKRPPHLLCHGPVGGGKTAYGRLLALELDTPYVCTVGAALETTKDVREFLRRLSRVTDKRLMVQVDEADGIGKSSAESLHSVLDEDVFYAPERQPLPETIWFFTTNYPSEIPESILSRCWVLPFEPYSEADLYKIAVNSAARLGLQITVGAAEWIAELSCFEPRRCNHLVATCGLLCTVEEETCIDADVVEAVAEKLRLAPGGLTPPEVAVLEYLARQPKCRAGLASISGALFTHSRDLQGRVEPALLRKGYLSVSGSGRVLTSLGMRYLQEISPT